MGDFPDSERSPSGRCFPKYLLKIAKHSNFQKVSLETGKDSHFDAAINLYKKFGFVEGEAFAQYNESEYSQFFHLNLSNQ